MTSPKGLGNEINVVAFLYVKKGKEDEFFSLLDPVIKHVKDNEPDTLSYYLTRQLGVKKQDEENGPTLIFIERYKSGQALNAHGNSAPFKKFFSDCESRGLFWKKSDIIPAKDLVDPQQGFRSRM